MGKSGAKRLPSLLKGMQNTCSQFSGIFQNVHLNPFQFNSILTTESIISKFRN